MNDRNILQTCVHSVFRKTMKRLPNQKNASKNKKKRLKESYRSSTLYADGAGNRSIPENRKFTVTQFVSCGAAKLRFSMPSSTSLFPNVGRRAWIIHFRVKRGRTWGRVEGLAEYLQSRTTGRSHRNINIKYVTEYATAGSLTANKQITPTFCRNYESGGKRHF